MNVDSIKSLSEQHQLLKKFYKACNAPHIKLRVNNPAEQDFMDKILDSATTKLIIADVRIIILKRISVIEKDIREEATDEH